MLIKERAINYLIAVGNVLYEIYINKSSEDFTIVAVLCLECNDLTILSFYFDLLLLFLKIYN